MLAGCFTSISSKIQALKITFVCYWWSLRPLDDFFIKKLEFSQLLEPQTNKFRFIDLISYIWQCMPSRKSWKYWSEKNEGLIWQSGRHTGTFPKILFIQLNQLSMHPQKEKRSQKKQNCTKSWSLNQYKIWKEFVGKMSHFVRELVNQIYINVKAIATKFKIHRLRIGCLISWTFK